jgi:hypothetical protein
MAMKRWILVCALIVLATHVVMADVPTTAEENNPFTNEEANACYMGGTWEGQCGNVDVNRDGVVEQWESDYTYTVGWYLIRFEFDIISREDFPVEYSWALPPKPEPVPSSGGPVGPPPGPACYDNTTNPSRYDVQYTGTPNVNTNLPRFSSTDGTCTGPIGPAANYYIVDNPAQCPLPNTVTMQAFGFTTAPAGLYICTSNSVP